MNNGDNKMDKISELNDEDVKLVKMAKDAMKYSYSPYSGFKVGAALIADNGQIYTGCNIENASYGATNCAERTAIFKAVSEGVLKISKIAIASSSGKETPPCGICRQVMSEFMDGDGKVLLSSNDDVISYRLSELLPDCFESDNMGR